MAASLSVDRAFCVPLVPQRFTLEYRKLPADYDADATARSARRLSSLPLTKLVERGGGSPHCTVRSNASFFPAPCVPTEPALLPPPPAWAQRMMMFWPNVVLDEQTDGHRGYCFYE